MIPCSFVEHHHSCPERRPKLCLYIVRPMWPHTMHSLAREAFPQERRCNVSVSPRTIYSEPVSEGVCMCMSCVPTCTGFSFFVRKRPRAPSTRSRLIMFGETAQSPHPKLWVNSVSTQTPMTEPTCVVRCGTCKEPLAHRRANRPEAPVKAARSLRSVISKVHDTIREVLQQHALTFSQPRPEHDDEKNHVTDGHRMSAARL